MATAATSLSFQKSMLMAQAGAGGENRAGGKLLRTRHCLLLPSPHSLHFSAEPGWPGAEQRPRSSWKKVDGTEHQGKGPSAQGGREPSPPPTAPHLVHSTENTSSPTTPCGGIPGSKGAGG